MSGVMRPRERLFPRHVWFTYPIAKGFHAPQKDNSVRQKRKAGLNNYRDQSHQRKPDTTEQAHATATAAQKTHVVKKRRFGRRK